MEPLKISNYFLLECYILNHVCFIFKEDNCGKDGRANLPQLLHLHEDTNWPELEFMYRLNENVV